MGVAAVGGAGVDGAGMSDAGMGGVLVGGATARFLPLSLSDIWYVPLPYQYFLFVYMCASNAVSKMQMILIWFQFS